MGICKTVWKANEEMNLSIADTVSPLRSLLRLLFASPIILYRKFISPLLPVTCRYYPSCSEYSRQAILKYGVIRGAFLGLGRILRCWNCFAGGDDPLPQTGSFREACAAYRRFYLGPGSENRPSHRKNQKTPKET